jgi:serine/threonine protein phosphatase PrpC
MQHSTKMPQHRMNQHIHTALHSHTQALPHFIFAHRTIACERHPERNEDSILIDQPGGLAGVFDGVGGSAAGEIASQTAAHATHHRWRQILEKEQKKRKIPTFLENCDKLNLCTILEDLIRDADEQVRTTGAQRAGTDDLATTVALAAFCRQSETRDYTMVFAHVGDSRIYLLREEEPLKRLTSDDGLLAKLIENQIINEADAFRIDQAMIIEQLSDTEISYFRLRGGITQALGGPLPPSIHIDQITIQPGDRILLCTDGIHDNLTDAEIEEILRKEPRTTTARILVERSIERSHDRSNTVRAKPDDMSAIVLTCRF